VTSCCEPPFIDDLMVCTDSAANLGNPPSCINSTNRVVGNKKSFSASFHAYSIKSDDVVRFTLLSTANDKYIIEEVSGVLDDFGSRVASTERCAYYMAYTFELPAIGLWPSIMLLEVLMTNKDSTFQLNLEVVPL